MTNDVVAGRTEVLAICLLAVILVLVTADLIADRGTGVRPGHLVVEGAAAAVSLAGVLILILRLRSLSRERRKLSHQLAASRDEARRWRGEVADLLDGLAVAIDRQFDRWRLTTAERDVALALLRGLSHQQIAGVRHTSERTVRQQAHLLYRKAGFASRADLAAFFLDGFLTPQTADPSPAGRGDEPDA